MLFFFIAQIRNFRCTLTPPPSFGQLQRVTKIYATKPRLWVNLRTVSLIKEKERRIEKKMHRRVPIIYVQRTEIYALIGCVLGSKILCPRLRRTNMLLSYDFFSAFVCSKHRLWAHVIYETTKRQRTALRWFDRAANVYT